MNYYSISRISAMITMAVCLLATPTSQAPLASPTETRSVEQLEQKIAFYNHLLGQHQYTLAVMYASGGHLPEDVIQQSRDGQLIPVPVRIAGELARRPAWPVWGKFGARAGAGVRRNPKVDNLIVGAMAHRFNHLVRIGDNEGAKAYARVVFNKRSYKGIVIDGTAREIKNFRDAWSPRRNGERVEDSQPIPQPERRPQAVNKARSVPEVAPTNGVRGHSKTGRIKSTRRANSGLLARKAQLRDSIKYYNSLIEHRQDRRAIHFASSGYLPEDAVVYDDIGLPQKIEIEQADELANRPPWGMWGENAGKQDSIQFGAYAGAPKVADDQTVRTLVEAYNQLVRAGKNSDAVYFARTNFTQDVFEKIVKNGRALRITNLSSQTVLDAETKLRRNVGAYNVLHRKGDLKYAASFARKNFPEQVVARLIDTEGNLRAIQQVHIKRTDDALETYKATYEFDRWKSKADVIPAPVTVTYRLEASDVRPGLFSLMYLTESGDAHPSKSGRAAGRVSKVYERETSVLYNITFENDALIQTTGDHRFMILGRGWVPASAIKVGDRSQTQKSGGKGLAIKHIEREELAVPIKVYNLEIEKYHNFYVQAGDVPILVHNGEYDDQVDGESVGVWDSVKSGTADVLEWFGWESAGNWIRGDGYNDNRELAEKRRQLVDRRQRALDNLGYENESELENDFRKNLARWTTIEEEQAYLAMLDDQGFETDQLRKWSFNNRVKAEETRQWNTMARAGRKQILIDEGQNQVIGEIKDDAGRIIGFTTDEWVYDLKGTGVFKITTDAMTDAGLLDPIELAADIMTAGTRRIGKEVFETVVETAAKSGIRAALSAGAQKAAFEMLKQGTVVIKAQARGNARNKVQNEIQKAGNNRPIKSHSAFETASTGGKHSGFLKQYKDKSPEEIDKGISSLQKQINTHREKIANPEKHIPNFKKLDPRQQEALVKKKWPADIQRQTEQKQILEGLRNQRGVE